MAVCLLDTSAYNFSPARGLPLSHLPALVGNWILVSLDISPGELGLYLLNLRATPGVWQASAWMLRG